jgi:hypothetical protein
MAYNKHELENDPLNAFEVGGYNTIKTFKQLQTRKFSPQLGFYAGNPEILQTIDFGETDDSFLDAILENKAKCHYAAYLAHRNAFEGSGYPYIISIEVFDFITGMTATLGIPYFMDNSYDTLRIQEPIVFGIQTEGVLNEDKAVEEKAITDLLNGVLKHSDHKEVWQGKYEGNFLPLQ